MESIPKKIPPFFPEIDYLRGLAILAVITTHITTYYIWMSTITNLALVYMTFFVLARYGVPVFLLVSGFVLYNKYNKEFNISEFYFKRFMSIIPPYFIFSVLYEIWNRQAITSVFITDLLTGNANQHLWFIVLIIEIYVTYPAIMRAYNYFRYCRETKYFLVLVFFIDIVYNLYLQPFWFIPKMFGLLFYFVLGMYMRDNYELIEIKEIMRKYWLLVITVICIGTVLGITQLVNAHFSKFILTGLLNLHLFTQLLDMLHCTALSLLAFYISVTLYKTKKAGFISVLGFFSFGIYLIHARIVVLVVFYLYNQGITVNDIFFYPITFIVTLLVSLAAVFVLKQLPGNEFIIGKT